MIFANWAGVMAAIWAGVQLFKKPLNSTYTLANCAASKLAMAAGDRLLTLAPNAPTCAGDKPSTCKASRLCTAAALKDDTLVPRALI